MKRKQEPHSGVCLVTGMLNEFILKQLDVVVRERESLSRQLDEVTGKENEENSSLQKLLDRDDVGVEVFSPRAAGKPVKIQVEDIRQRIEDLECQEAMVRDQLEQTLLKEEKLRKMLSEARVSNQDVGLSGETDGSGAKRDDQFIQIQAETHEELQVILKRIDHCFEICMSDPEACRNELRTLQYYLKALLTKTERL